MITGADGWSPTDPAVASAVAATPGVDGVTAVRQDVALAFGDKEIVNSIDPKTVGGLFSFDYKDGSDAALARLGRDGAIVDEGWATEQQLAVGKRFDVTSAKGDDAAPDGAGDREVAGDRRDRARPDHDLAGAPSSGAFESDRNVLTFVSAV